MKKISVFALLCLNFAINAQTIVVKVIDADTKEPLISASVYYKNGGGGTVTNAEGEFIIGKLENSDSLHFSYIGYRSENFAADKIP